jgi:hypothetical protein
MTAGPSGHTSALQNYRNTIRRVNRPQDFVDALANRVNYPRSHDALAERTPVEYLQTLGSGTPPLRPRPICAEPGWSLNWNPFFIVFYLGARNA